MTCGVLYPRLIGSIPARCPNGHLPSHPLFRGRRRGWSENYYCEKDAVADVVTPAHNLAGIRRGMIPSTVRIKAVRMSAIGFPRDSRFLDAEDTSLGAGTWNGGTAGNVGGYNTAWNALKVELQHTDSQKNFIFMRGLPDELMINGNYVPTNEWIGLMADFQTMLVLFAHGFRIRVKTAHNPATYSFLQVNRVRAKGLTRRNPGRPFDQYPGRRRTTRRGLIRVVRSAIMRGVVTKQQLASLPDPPVNP